MRANLPEPEQHSHFVAWMIHAVLQAPTEQAILVVIDHTEPPGSLPHRDLVLACSSALNDAGIQVTARLWAPATTARSPWVSDTAPAATGVVADGADIIAAVGLPDNVVCATRDALAATLAPDAPDVLARRAKLIDQLAEHDTILPLNRAGQLAFVEDAIGCALDGVLPAADAEFARLAISLSDNDVRDALLTLDDSARVEAAEQLWTVLLRGTPAPYRCQAACLLAFSAYARGHAALASVASEASDRNHRVTGLLHDACNLGIHPEEMRQVAIEAAREARVAIQQDGTPPA
jgi:hypothetical protein